MLVLLPAARHPVGQRHRREADQREGQAPGDRRRGLREQREKRRGNVELQERIARRHHVAVEPLAATISHHVAAVPRQRQPVPERRDAAAVEGRDRLVRPKGMLPQRRQQELGRQHAHHDKQSVVSKPARDMSGKRQGQLPSPEQEVKRRESWCRSARRSREPLPSIQDRAAVEEHPCEDVNTDQTS